MGEVRDGGVSAAGPGAPLDAAVLPDAGVPAWSGLLGGASASQGADGGWMKGGEWRSNTGKSVALIGERAHLPVKKEDESHVGALRCAETNRRVVVSSSSR